MASGGPSSSKQHQENELGDRSGVEVLGTEATLINEIKALHISRSPPLSESSVPTSEKPTAASGTTTHDSRPEEKGSSQSSPDPNSPQPKPVSHVSVIEKAIDTVRQAIEADNSMSYQTAHDLYLQALHYFLAALKTERNPKARDLIRKKTAEYMGRAEQLQAHLTGKGTSSGKPATKPTSKNQDASMFLDKSPPGVNWADIGGRSAIQQKLLNAVILPARFPQLFTGLRKATTRILLYGPLGTGKTTLVKALAAEAKRALFRVNSREFVKEDGGKGVATVLEQLFTAAREHQPSIVQIDDFQQLSTHTGRLLLEELERDTKSNNKKPVTEVILIGITTKPWDLEPETRAIFQETVHVPIPDETSRREILIKQIYQIRFGGSKIECEERLLTPETYTHLAKLTDGYSVRDIIEGVVKAALMGPVTKIQMASHRKKITIESGEEHWTPCSPGDRGAEPRDWTSIPADRLLEPPLTVNDFLNAIKGCKPSVDDGLVREYENWEYESGLGGAGRRKSE